MTVSARATVPSCRRRPVTARARAAPDGGPRRAGAEASAAAWSGVCMTVGATTQRTPQASTAAARRRRPRRSPGCRRTSAYRRATPTTVGSWPSSASSRSAGPLRAAPATMGETATTSAPAGRQRVGDARARPGAGRSRRSGWTGRPPRPRRRRWRRAPRGRAGAARRPSKRTDSTATACRRPTKYSWNDDLGAVDERHPGAHGVVGHGQRAGPPTPRAAVISAVTSRQRGALGTAAGCGRGGWRGRGRRGGTRSRRRGARGCPSTAQVSPARPQPALVVVQPGQGVGHGVEVGADVQAVQHGVVAGVDHGRDLGGRDDAHEAAQQAGGTHSSGEGGDHGARLTVRARPSPGAPVCKARPVPARARPDERAPPGGRRRHAAARHANRGGSVLRGRPGSARRRARARRGRLRRDLAPAPIACRRSCPPGCACASGPCRPVRCTWRGRTCRGPGRRVVRGAGRRGPRHQLRRAAHAGGPPGSSPCTTSPPSAIPELCDRSTLGFPRMVRRAVADGAWVHTPSQFVADEVVAEFGADPGGCGSCTTACPRRAAPRRAVARRRLDRRAARRGRRATSSPSAPSSPARTTPGWCAPSTGCRRRASRRGPRDRRRRRLGRRRLPRRARGVADAATGSCSSATSTTTTSARWLAGPTVLAFPSVYEGFGFPPLEAMAAGVPVVATRGRGGARGRGRRRRAGRAAATSTPWPRALVAVLGDADGRAALVDKGRRRAARFTWEACGAGLAALYADAAARPARSRRGRRAATVAAPGCLLVAEQLRRRVPGGIGTYVRACSAAWPPWTAAAPSSVPP